MRTTSLARLSQPHTWRGLTMAIYAGVMGIAKGDKGRHYAPVRMPDTLAQYQGLWVAVKDGEILAAAASSRDLVRDLARLGPVGRGATMQRVPNAERGLMVGIG